MRHATLIAAAVTATACTKPAPLTPGSEVAIAITAADESPLPAGLKDITVRDLRFAAARLRFERDESLFAAPLSDELAEHVVEQAIEQRLLAIEADALGVKASTTAVQAELTRMEDDHGARQFERVLMNTYQRKEDLRRAIARRMEATEVMQRKAFVKAEVTDDDLKRFWKARAEREKVEPERVHAAQILVRTEEDGKQAQRALAKKEPFADVARRMSIGPEAVRGGDLGWFARGDMPKVFDEACFGMPEGKVSALTPSEFGYHLCTVLERKPQRPLSFEEARPELTRQAQEDAQRDAEANFRAELRDKYTVTKNAEAITKAFSP